VIDQLGVHEGVHRRLLLTGGGHALIKAHWRISVKAF